LQLHQTIGNRAAGRLIQAKLRINPPSDQYEQEADRIAEMVLRMPAPAVQRKCAACAFSKSLCPKCAENEELRMQRKPLAASITPLVQRQPESRTGFQPVEALMQRQPVEEEEGEEMLQTKTSAGQTPQVTSQISAQINSLHGGGQPLPPSVRAFFEPRFGTDLRGVRVRHD